jgi:hypothetical protein
MNEGWIIFGVWWFFILGAAVLVNPGERATK